MAGVGVTVGVRSAPRGMKSISHQPQVEVREVNTGLEDLKWD